MIAYSQPMHWFAFIGKKWTGKNFW